jgi:hypothetical protein
VCGNIIIIMGVLSWLYPSEFVIWCLEDVIKKVPMNLCFKNGVMLNSNNLYLLVLVFLFHSVKMVV